MTIRVLVADDEELVRAGFRRLLEGEPDITVVVEARDGHEAVALARGRNIDVALMDVRMPRLDGLEATRWLLRESPATKVVILTTYDLDEYVFDALHAGASGFLLKDSTPEELIGAVRVTSRGDALLAPSITRRLILEFTHVHRHDPEPADLSALTAREREVLLLLARGGSNAEIAAELLVSDATVKTHVAAVLSKLGLRDRVQAVIRAYESGLVRPGDQ